MSSNIWTLDELSSNSRHASGRCWRLVETQHQLSTIKLTDTRYEQERLEDLLEDSKPPVPEECRDLGFLLFTPFRYGPYPNSSRFRRAGHTAGVFYASELPRTAATEMVFLRLLFFAESAETPWPSNPGEYTAFAAEYATGRSLDLRAPPFDVAAATWTHPTDYDGCQKIADNCRQQDIDIIKYQSARDLERGTNVAVLRCRAFASHDAVERQTWHIQVSDTGARSLCEFPRSSYDFDCAYFAGDPRIARMVWDR